MTMQVQIGFIKFTYKSAVARLTLWNDGSGHVSGVHARDRGKGHATKVMKELLAYADRFEVLLRLEASPYGEGEDRLSAEDLVKFYEKLGFSEHADSCGYPIEMKRDWRRRA